MPMIDEKALREFYQGDEALLSDIADIFVENLPRSTNRLRAAIVNQDAGELREIAHQFKSGLGYFFAADLNRIAAELEGRGKDRLLQGCEELTEELFCGLHHLLGELSCYTQVRYQVVF